MTSPHPNVANPLPNTRNAQPPPLPPRAKSTKDTSHPLMATLTKDPRSASMQSLVPDPASQNPTSIRRRLLLVYIHGFMGNETSFRSFPAHVHNLVAVTLSDSHVVHTKIYPRYLSRNAIQEARDRFAAWLAPHADEWTDIILLGHSMGGLLAADTVLLFRYNIVGTIHLDVPLLGISPKIVKAGLSSIFTAQPAPHDVIVQEEGGEEKPGRTSTLLDPNPPDPNYNPSYDNDVRLPVRKGWENTFHWVSKHYKDGLREATKGLIKSHLKFGFAMGDWHELKDRYAKVRVLEECDENRRKSTFSQAQSVPRVRFVNYYTVSTGRPKKPKSPKSPKSPASSRSNSPQPQLRENERNELDTISRSTTNERDKSPENSELTLVDPIPSTDNPEFSDDDQTRATPTTLTPAQTISAQSTELPSETPPDLPEIPPIPKEPAFVDLAQFSDKAERRAAEKAHDQALKEYQKEVKARNKIIHQRDKAEEKWAKQQEKRQAELKKKAEKAEKEKAEKEKAEKEKAEKEKAEKEKAEKDKPPKSKPLTHHESEMLRLEAESKRMQAEAERMQGGPKKAQENDDASQKQPKSESASIVDVESDLEDLHIQDNHTDDQKPTLHHPYTDYEFSRSTIMSQASPDEQSSLAESEATSRSSHSNSKTHAHHERTDSAPESPPKKKYSKKFCLLPPKDASGNRDPTWIPVFMDGIDEVTAHTSLFFMNETYERLVGDVGARIEEWTREADSVRLAREMEGLE